MFALYKLQAKAYFSNLFAKIDFLMGIVFLVAWGAITLQMAIGKGAGSVGQEQASLTIISSLLLLQVASSAINTFGISFYEMKESVLLKRIGATEITKPKAIISFILWGMTTMVFTLLWMIMWVAIFQIPAVHHGTGGLLYIGDSLKNANIGGMLLAIIITMISFYAIAFFFVSITKNSQSYQMVTTFYYFFIAFLGGAFTPTASREWMTVIGYMSPLGWGTKLMANSSLGYDVFNSSGYFVIQIHDGQWAKQWVEQWETICTFVLPVVYGGLAGLASAKFFKWD